MNLTITNKILISDALKKINPGDTLILDDGIYNEKIEVWVPNITIKSKNPNKAILCNKDYYHKIMPNHNECNTFNTFTLFIGANNVTLEDLTIKNEAVPSHIYGQAVALHVDGNNFICKNCIIESAQDTLFTGPMPADLIERYQGFYNENRLNGTPSIQKYLSCKIIGDVDYIFGCATALFEKCEIVTLKRNNNNPTYICAPAHPKELEYGYLFYKCKLVGCNQTFLGRPWRDYGCAAFLYCEMDSNVIGLGFNKWNNTNRDKTARFYEYTENVDLSLREPWVHILSRNEADKYILDFYSYIETQLKK